MPETEPTKEQIAAAKAAGWDPADGPPPGGWDVHGTDPGPVQQLDGVKKDD